MKKTYQVEILRESDGELVAICHELMSPAMASIAALVEDAATSFIRNNPPLQVPCNVNVELATSVKTDQPDRTTALLMLSAASRSGDIGAMTLAAQLAGCPACPACGFVQYHCKCGDQNGTTNASRSGHTDQTSS